LEGKNSTFELEEAGVCGEDGGDEGSDTEDFEFYIDRISDVVVGSIGGKRVLLRCFNCCRKIVPGHRKVNRGSKVNFLIVCLF
jgi:hypothetical protein